MIFDTDILIWFTRKHPGAAAFISEVPVAERNVSTISWLELLYGCRNQREFDESRRLITEAFGQVLPLSESISESARRLMEQYVLLRRPDSNDVLIAATALERGETLATANRKHFDFVPGLEIKVFRP